MPQFATVNAPSKAAAAHNILLNPYGFLANRVVLENGVPALRQSNELRAGIDSKIVLREGVTLDSR